ncbi:MAG: hypothetical protein ACK5NF_02785, partial [Bacilli bacterium]
ESSNKEYTLIYNHVKLNPNLSLVDLLVKLKRKGIITSTPKEYETMSYPSERVQVDVKHLPSISLTSSLSSAKYYQYTCINQYYSTQD